MVGLPVIRSTGMYDSDTHFPLLLHSPDRAVEEFEMEWHYQDGGVSILNGREYPIRQGMLLIAKPGDVRSTILPVRNRFIRISRADEGFARLVQGVAGVTVLSGTDACDALFARVSEWFLSDDDYRRASASALLFDVLRLAKEARMRRETAEMREGDVVARAQKYMDENYQQELSVEELARLCHVSTPYLHRLFVNRLGVTPHHALIRRRLMAAKVMLINEPCPVAEVAWKCGFQSASYFSDCFRKHEGMSPKDFRKENGYRL